MLFPKLPVSGNMLSVRMFSVKQHYRHDIETAAHADGRYNPF